MESEPERADSKPAGRGEKRPENYCCLYASPAIPFAEVQTLKAKSIGKTKSKASCSPAKRVPSSESKLHLRLDFPPTISKASQTRICHLRQPYVFDNLKPVCNTTPVMAQNPTLGEDCPSLLHLISELNSEVGLCPLWRNLIQFLVTHCHAIRVDLLLPNDSTDVLNMPWGVKAFYDQDLHHTASNASYGRIFHKLRSLGDFCEKSAIDTSAIQQSIRDERIIVHTHKQSTLDRRLSQLKIASDSPVREPDSTPIDTTVTNKVQNSDSSESSHTDTIRIPVARKFEQEDAEKLGSNDSASDKKGKQPVYHPELEDSDISILHIPLIHPHAAPVSNLAHQKSPSCFICIHSKLAPFPPHTLSLLGDLSPILCTFIVHALHHANMMHEIYRERLSNEPKPSVAQQNDSGLNEYYTSPGSCTTSPSSTPSFEVSGCISVGHLTASPGSSLRGYAKDYFSRASTSFETFPTAEHTSKLPCKNFLRSKGAAPIYKLARWRSPKKFRNKSQERSSQPRMPSPSLRLLKVLIDSIPVHIFTLAPSNAEITWVNGRTLAYRGQSVEEFFQKPWDAIEPSVRNEFIQRTRSVFTDGYDGFSEQLKLRRFDGEYRWFIVRLMPLRNTDGTIVHWFHTAMDIHDQKLALMAAAEQAELVQKEIRNRTLAEASPLIVFAVSATQGITYANQKWESYSGQPTSSALGFGFLPYVHPDDRKFCFKPFERTKSINSEDKKSEPIEIEVRLKGKDDEYRWHLARCIETEDLPQGNFLGTCVDIHNQKIVEAQLLAASEASQRSVEVKTRFLSNMSHEMRTPLIGISGMVNFLLNTELSAQQLDYAHTIQQSADALLLIINDILDLSKIEAGKMVLTTECFSVRNMIEDTNEILSTMASSKGLDLNYAVSDDVPNELYGDRFRLRQVFLNILGNAIKFTNEGEVFSKCSVLSVDGDHLILEFSVSDTGVGFDEKESKLMFQPFSQVDDSTTRRFGGTGLGLSISKNLIELHGGKLSCKSEKGIGSTFVFTAKVARKVLPLGDEHSGHPQSSIKSDESDMPSKRCQSFIFMDSNYDKHPEFQDAYSGPVSTKYLYLGTSELRSSEAKAATDITSSYDEKVLIVSPMKYDRLATIDHITKTLPITKRIAFVPVRDISSALHHIASGINFTYVTINLGDVSIVAKFLSHLNQTEVQNRPVILVITTPVQRSAILQDIRAENAQFIKDNVKFLFKPLKPAKLAPIFDLKEERSESADTKHKSAQVSASSQKTMFKKMNDRVAGRGLKGLIIEDNPINQKVLRRLLEKAGIEVETAWNGVEGMQIFLEKGYGYFAVILCDLHMPLKDGWAVCSELRAWEAENLLPGARVTPLIAVSANVLSDVPQRCLTAGFTAFCSKPLDFVRFQKTLMNVLEDHIKHSC